MNEHTQGLSRAAKKRAKKKHKKQIESKDTTTTAAAVVVVMESSHGTEQKRKEQGQSQHSEARKKKARVEQQQQVALQDVDDVESEPEYNSDEEEENEGLLKASKKEQTNEDVSSNDHHHHLLSEDSFVPESMLKKRKIKQVCDLLVDQESCTAKQRASCALSFLFEPAGISNAEFYEKYWEKKPLHVCYTGAKEDSTEKDHYKKRFDGLLSIESIRQMIRNHPHYYGRDLNVTRYERSKDGVHRRVTLDLLKNGNDDNDDDDDNDDPEKHFVRVEPDTLWGKHFKKGCTLRLLCPHKHADNVHALLSLLELEWGCMVGANAYLTPAFSKSQGFAPHYDDIEAFCLQLQGRKRWKVYPPIKKSERLPRVSSEDYTEDDLKDIKPILDVILEPGDVLYMPRGWIHQGCSVPESDGSDDEKHSLHLTVSAMQQWAWADLFETLLPEALTSLTNSETSTIMRSGLPRQFLDYMGVVHDNSEDTIPEPLKRKLKEYDEDDTATPDPEDIRKEKIKKLQDEFRSETKKRIMRVAQVAMDMLDAVCDQMGKRFLSDRLPPALTEMEKSETDQGRRETVKVMPNTLCRLVRPGVARLAIEEGMAILYHCMDNSRVHQEHALSPMEFEMDDAPAIEQLLTTVEPHWICVADLRHDTIEDKVGVAQALYDEGILATRTVN